MTDLMASQVVDDVHLSSQTSDLIKLLVENIRRSFIRIQAPASGSETASRENSRHQTPHRQHQDLGEAQQTLGQRPQTSSSLHGPSLQADPLAGIQAQQMADFTNTTFMPPPSYNMLNGLSQNLSFDPNLNASMGDWNDDWLALPLDNFFEPSTGTVDHSLGGLGPTIGDRDMLELLTDKQFDQMPFSIPASSSGGNFGTLMH